MHDSVRRLSHRSARWLLICFILLATLLRVVNIDSKSLWMDEIATVLDARLNWIEFVENRTSWDYPFLFFYLVKAFTVFSESPFWVRLPSLFAGVLSVVVLYRVSAALFSKPVALVSTFLMAIFPLGIYYSQEARPYSFLILFDLLGRLWALMAVLKRKRYAWYLLVGTYFIGILTTYFVGLSMINVIIWIFLLQLYQILKRESSLSALVTDYFHTFLASCVAIGLFWWFWYPEFGEFYQARLSGGGKTLTYLALFQQYQRIVDVDFPLLNNLCGVGLVALGVVLSRKYVHITFLITGLIGSFLVYQVTGVQATRTRYYLHIVPYILIAISISVVKVWSWTRKQWHLSRKSAFLLLIAASVSVSAGWIAQLPHTLLSEKLNYEDGAHFIEERLLPGDVIVIQSMDGGQYEYYFSKSAQDRIVDLSPEEMRIRCLGGQRVWFTGSNILNLTGEKQLDWAQKNMDFLISFPGYSESKTVEVYRCGETDVQPAIDMLEREVTDKSTPDLWLELGELYVTRGAENKAMGSLEKFFALCTKETCSPELFFRAHMAMARAYYSLDEIEAAVAALKEVASLSALPTYHEAYRREIKDIYQRYVQKQIGNNETITTSFSVPRRISGREEDLKGWRLPDSDYGLKVTSTPDCAFNVGEEGIMLLGSSKGYHNGISAPLPFQVVAGNYYAVGVHIRAVDEGKGLFDHLFVDPLYLGGQDAEGNYHGSHFSGKDNRIAARHFSDWQFVVRVFRAKDWMEGTLTLSPVLLTGRGYVCIDRVFAIPLPMTQQVEAEALLEQREFTKALMMYETLLRDCTERDCSPDEVFFIKAKIARAKVGLGKRNEALSILQEAIEEHNPSTNLIDDLRADLISIYQTLLVEGYLTNYSVPNGGFEEGLTGWSLPAARYSLSAEVNERCAYQGKYGLLIEGPDESYHNGPSVALTNVKARQHYVIGAMVRQIGDVVELEQMYLGGRDAEGTYRGSHGSEIELESTEWRPGVRLVYTPEWTDFRLTPVLLTGKGPVCLDGVAVIPLSTD